MKTVFLNGKLVDADRAHLSIFDHGFLYGDGVYETLRTYKGEVWQLSKHLQRLQNSARLLRLRLPFDQKKLAQAVQMVVQKNGYSESRIRITLTRGVNGFDFASCRKPTLLITVEPLKPEPLKIYKEGVNIITVPFERFLPEVKSISLLPFVMGRQKVAQKKAYEAVFVGPDGLVREGTVTNIFMVRDGVIMTPRSRILKGIMREFLLKSARKSGLKVMEKDFTVAELYRADEVFITNAVRGVVPVVQVDGRKIGKGKLGRVTAFLKELCGKNKIEV